MVSWRQLLEAVRSQHAYDAPVSGESAAWSNRCPSHTPPIAAGLVLTAQPLTRQATHPAAAAVLGATSPNAGGVVDDASLDVDQVAQTSLLRTVIV